MFTQPSQSIIIFIACVVILLLFFSTFIVSVVYKYKQKQIVHFKRIEELKAAHENAILRAQLEMQEYTFQNISREIHDNIGQKLSLVKLYLNTFPPTSDTVIVNKVQDSVEILSEVINDLSDIARSMSSEIIVNNGLSQAIELEVEQLRKSGVYIMELSITGDCVFLNSNKELIIFRIFQESLHNIVKHADASEVTIGLHYGRSHLGLAIKDNGKGFNCEGKKSGSGLANIRKRTAILKGDFSITSGKDGTQLIINIPIQ